MTWLEARLDRLGRSLLEWWAWPATLVGLTAVVLLASWAMWPGPDGGVAFLGGPSFPTCRTLLETGEPCGQCGMTRSWVWSARGRLALAFRYSPAGLALWTWLVAGGLVGALRLARRDPALFRWRAPVLGLAAVAWLVLYGVAHQLRLAGLLPLP